MNDHCQFLPRSPSKATVLKMTATSSTTHVQLQRRSYVISLMWISALLWSLQLSGISAQVTPPATGFYQITVLPGAVRTETQFILLSGFVVYGSNFSLDDNPPPANQFIALDLTVPWNTSRPVWSTLKSDGSAGVGPSDPNMAVSGPTLPSTAMAVSQDGKYMNTFGSNYLSKVLSYRYTFATGTWAASSITAVSPGVEDRMVAQDTDTGLVYLPGGYNSPAYSSLLVYDFQTDTIVKNLTIPVNIPGTTVPLWADRGGYFSVVYSPYRKSLLFFGGIGILNTSTPVPGVITEYVPATDTWSVPTTQGVGPSHRVILCMATNADGTKLVILGGQLDTGVFANDLWVLDVPSMTWTQGPSTSQARVASVCTVVNDTLINWGGYNGLFPQPVDVLLYDLQTSKFVTAYKPTPPPKSSVGGNGSSGNTSSHSKGAVIGGSVTGVVILVAAAGAGFFFHRRRRSLQQKKKTIFQMTDREGDNGDDGPGIGNATLQGKDTPATGVINKMSSAPRLDTSLLGFIPSYRRGETGPEAVPMKEEFQEQEKEWWRGTSPSQPYPVATGNKDEWIQKESVRMAMGPVKALNAGVAVTNTANSLSPIGEHWSFTPEAQPAQGMVLNSPDSARTTTSSLVGTPSTLINQLPYQQQHQQQHYQQSFTPRFEQQQWPSSVSPITSQRKGEEQGQPWTQQQRTEQVQRHQDQQGPVSPPPLNYNTRPGGQKP